MKKKEKKTEVKFVFDNQKAAEHFLTWLCESGEQSYWQWQECRETEEDGDITVLEFDYFSNPKKFGKGDIICECGRMDKDWTSEDER